MQKNNRKQSILALILSIMMMSLLSISLTACNETTDTPNTEKENQITEATLLGEGQTIVYLTVVSPEQQETHFEIHTGQVTVGAALKELGLISGEEGPYGLNVKTVYGVTLDYRQDKMYWAFYINDSYAPTGVDDTDIVAGSHYTLKAEKA